MVDLPNVRRTLRRQSTPTSLVILICAAFTFGPQAYDTMTGQPWINAEMELKFSEGGEIIVDDTVTTNAPVIGTRANVIELPNGEIVCSADQRATWLGERTRLWHLGAFVQCDRLPEEFRVCSLFAVSSPSGRALQFGPFCTGYLPRSDAR